MCVRFFKDHPFSTRAGWMANELRMNRKGDHMNAYTIIVRLLVVSAFLQLGLNLSRIENCDSRMCMDEIQRSGLRVLKIDWRPIGVFPEEAKRYR